MNPAMIMCAAAADDTEFLTNLGYS